MVILNSTIFPPVKARKVRIPLELIVISGLVIAIGHMF